MPKKSRISKETGLTFDDILVIPGYSEVLPREVNTTSWLTKKIRVNIPIVSAAMDTVTESPLAIAIAQEGGVGVIHKNMSIEAQAEEVRKVKRSRSGMILDPITLPSTATVKEALVLMKENSISGIPIIDEKGKLLGLVTSRDLKSKKIKLDFLINDIMTPREKLIVSIGNISLSQAEEILDENKIEKLPVVDKNNLLIGLITYRDISKAKTQPNACKDISGRLIVGAGVGVTPDVLTRVKSLVKSEVDFIVIDTAHAHSNGVIETLKKVKLAFPDLQVIVGNIATGEAAIALVENGADAIKVGIGPGSICTTRIIAGIGVPQFTAIMNVAEAIKDSGVPVIADGGIKTSGDIVKALAAGANTVMIGSLLAGVEESPGNIIISQGRKYKEYRGMGSLEAMQEGSKDRYFQDMEDDVKKLVPEGVVGRVPLKGNLAEVVYQFVGGLRAGMGYTGSKDIPSLWNCKFTRITNAGIVESLPHDITITSESPNFSAK
jgi:IMP dehydrogenase